MTRIHPLLIAAAALVALPFVILAAGLTYTSATEVVVYGLACMGLNILAGRTGLVSFGHGAWFGMGAYFAGLTSLAMGGSFLVPLLVAVIGFSLVFGGVVLARMRALLADIQAEARLRRKAMEAA